MQNRYWSGRGRDKGVSRIDVTIDVGVHRRRCPVEKAPLAFTVVMSVRNDGAGIPVLFHEKHQMYIPELVMGTLMTGTQG
jgi:DNA topoisomerase-2